MKEIKYGITDREGIHARPAGLLVKEANKYSSCLLYTSVDRFAQSLPKHLVMSYKPNPAVLGAETFDEQAARQELRRAGSAAQQNGLVLEIILKDLSTVQHQPQRLTRWNEIASELFC